MEPGFKSRESTPESTYLTVMPSFTTDYNLACFPRSFFPFPTLVSCPIHTNYEQSLNMTNSFMHSNMDFFLSEPCPILHSLGSLCEQWPLWVHCDRPVSFTKEEPSHFSGSSASAYERRAFSPCERRGFSPCKNLHWHTKVKLNTSSLVLLLY